MPHSQHSLSDEQLNAGMDAGLRAFLARVYLKISAGLALSAGVAAAIAGNRAVRDVFFAVSGEGAVSITAAGVGLLLSPLLVMIGARFLLRDPTGRGAGLVFWILSALIGGSLTLVSLVFTGAGLISTFLVTAAAFAALSFWGYITHQNLRGLESFLSLALSGFIFALIVNLILESPVVNLVLNALGVLVFSSLIASDTQRLKRIYYESTDPDYLEAISNFGALDLYLNFINLFLLLISLSFRRTAR